MEINSPKVLIAGAGPTGLMLACQLARFEVPFRIIDKKSGPSEQSKALGVQARTLELFDQMGIAQRAIEQGQEVESLNIFVRGKKVRRVVMKNMGEGQSPFPYVLILEQNKTEQLLIHYLKEKGIEIEWNTELCEFRQDEKQVVAIIQKNAQRMEVRADWLVGTDGAGSPVRHGLNLKFKGETYSQSFLLSDVKLDWEHDYKGLCVALTSKSFVGYFPMTGDQRYRIISTIPEEMNGKEQLTFDDVKDTLEQHSEINMKLSEPKWFSTYHLHHRCVEQFRVGRAFLAGDSAHVHSPAGAQGMNTGILDAHNLAWKLAYVIQGKLNARILDTYHAERHPIAEKLVRGTDKLFNVISSKQPVLRFIRLNLMPHIMRFVTSFRKARRLMFRFVSQTSIHYHENLLVCSNYGTGLPKNSPETGRRFPYVLLNIDGQKQSIYSFFRDNVFHALIFTDQPEGPYISGIHKYAMDLAGIMKVDIIKKNSLSQNDLTCLCGKRNAMYLLRPDQHIALKSDNLNVNILKEYFEKLQKYPIESE